MRHGHFRVLLGASASLLAAFVLLGTAGVHSAKPADASTKYAWCYSALLGYGEKRVEYFSDVVEWTTGHYGQVRDQWKATMKEDGPNDGKTYIDNCETDYTDESRADNALRDRIGRDRGNGAEIHRLTFNYNEEK